MPSFPAHRRTCRASLASEQMRPHAAKRAAPRSHEAPPPAHSGAATPIEQQAGATAGDDLLHVVGKSGARVGEGVVDGAEGGLTRSVVTHHLERLALSVEQAEGELAVLEVAVEFLAHRARERAGHVRGAAGKGDRPRARLEPAEAAGPSLSMSRNAVSSAATAAGTVRFISGLLLLES